MPSGARSDHATNLTAAASLTVILVQLGEAEPARRLGEDTLRRSRQVLGPDQVITLWAAGALALALTLLDEAEPARTLGEDTLRRCQRALRPNHPLTQYLTEAAGISHPSPGGDAAADSPSSPL